jgi:protein phosphatase 1 regulatory subunit 7
LIVKKLQSMKYKRIDFFPYHRDLFTPKDDYGNKMLKISSDALILGIEEMKELSIFSIVIDEYFFKSNDLSTLIPFKNQIQGLCIDKKMSLVHLNEFDQLKYLIIGRGFNELIDLKHIPNLEILSVCQNKKIINYNFLKKLRLLEIRGSENEDLTYIQNLENLEQLTLMFSKHKSLKGIGELKNLKKLTIQECRNLENIGNIAEADKLEEILLDNVPKMKDYKGLDKLGKLKDLRLFNAGQIENLSFLNHMPEINTFFVDKFIVLDGDMTPCIGIQNLKFNHKPHYSHKLKEIKLIQK